MLEVVLSPKSHAHETAEGEVLVNCTQMGAQPVVSIPVKLAVVPVLGLMVTFDVVVQPFASVTFTV